MNIHCSWQWLSLKYWEQAHTEITVPVHWCMSLRLRQMVIILQLTLSNAFSSMKLFIHWFKFHCSLFLSIQLTSNISSHNGLALSRPQAIILTNDGIVNCHMYVSLGLNELISNKRCVSSHKSSIDNCWDSNLLCSQAWTMRFIFWTLENNDFVIHRGLTL